MSSRDFELGRASLSFSRRMLMALLDGTPAELWHRAPVPGGNSAIWLAGHVAWEDDAVLQDLDDGRGSVLPDTWHERFAQGTRPSADLGEYPPIADIRAQMDTRRAEFIAYFESRADRLAEPLPQRWHGFARDRAALMNAVACHEMIHVGQLTVVRKSLDLPPVFG